VRVLFDANALMMPLEKGVDIFSEVESLVGGYEPIVPTEVRSELAGLARERGRRGAAARFGLALAAGCREVELGDGDTPVDERIARYARDRGCLVATSDRALRRALLEDGVGVIALRGSRRVTLERG